MWNSGVWAEEGAIEEEGAMTGRLGRFNRRFETGKGMDWMQGVGVEESNEGKKEK
jgi:hypothetical protein